MNEQQSESHFFSGEIIGSCVLLKNLRVRAHAEVWYCIDRTAGRPAVLKLIRRDHRRADIFPHLAEVLLQMDCPQLIRLLAFFPAGEYHAAEFEYAACGTVASRLKRLGQLPLGEAVFVLRESLTALGALHDHGIIHRDVKSGNLWIDSEGGVRLGDFSIAGMKKHREPSPAVFGTPSVMSPEQTKNTAGVDFRSDFFSLASTVYELLTGQPRFPHGDFLTARKMIPESDPESMGKKLAQYAPDDLIGLLIRMSAIRPADRPRDARSILEELKQMRLPAVQLR